MSCRTRTAPPPRSRATGTTWRRTTRGAPGSSCTSTGGGVPSAQRSRELRGDVRMADDFEIVTILGGLRKTEHRRHGRIRQHQPSGAVDEHDAFDHPGQNRLHVRAFARHLGEPGAELSRRVVEDVRDQTNLVAPVVSCRPGEISSLVALGRVHDGAQPPVDDHRRRGRSATSGRRETCRQVRRARAAGRCATRSSMAVSGSATRTNATGPARDRDRRVLVSMPVVGARPRRQCPRPTAALRQLPRARRGSRPTASASQSTSESPSTCPSASMNVTLRADQPADLIGLRSGSASVGLVRQQRGGQPRLVEKPAHRCPRRMNRRNACSTSIVETASAIDEASKMPTNDARPKGHDVLAGSSSL